MSVLVIDKPVGPTSLDVVKRVQRAFARVWGAKAARATKFGHGGTLDPLASGVLPVCIGEGTKLAPFLLDADKGYEAVLRLGVETTTLDAAGEVVAERDVPPLTPEDLRAALARFEGPLAQVPPMYSALKRDGRPLYEYARAGETLERAPRQIVVHEIRLLAFAPPAEVTFAVRCSKGTYVRVLAADIGQALGVGAHVTALRRTSSGPFALERAVTPDELEARLERGEAAPFVALADALGHLPAAEVSAAVTLALVQGKRVSWETLGPGAPLVGRVRVLREDGSLIAVAEPRDDGTVRTLRVFNTADSASSGARATAET